MNEKINRPRRFRWKVLLEIVVYAAVVLALAYAARQFEGISVGKIKTNVPSFLDFFK